MIRKQLYVAERHQQKLRELASKWRCSEAEVVRRAIDRLPEPEKSLDELIVERLTQAGILEKPPDYPDIPKGEAGRRFREELERKIASRKELLGLTQAVLEDRR